MDLQTWLVPLLTVAAAFGGVKQALNGTAKRVENIDKKLDETLKTQSAHGERIAKLEALSE